MSVIYTSQYRSPSELLIKSNDELKWAKPVATELLVIRISKPLAAKPTANWAMKTCVCVLLMRLNSGAYLEKVLKFMFENYTKKYIVKFCIDQTKFQVRPHK